MTREEYLGSVKVGDTVLRLLAGTIPMKLKVKAVDDQLIHTAGDWTFDKKTGAEVDEELGWGPERTGSLLVAPRETANGYVVKVNEELKLFTVFSHPRGAMANGLQRLFNVTPQNDWSEEKIEELWDVCVAEAGKIGHAVMVVPVSVAEVRDD